VVEICFRGIQGNEDLVHLVLLVVAFVRDIELRKIQAGAQVSIGELHQHLGIIACRKVKWNSFGSGRPCFTAFSMTLDLSP
jgi:hypothetical protein